MNDCMTQGDAMNMNNEQAVSILIPLRDMMRDQYGCPISDAYFALDKAIEALKQLTQPNTPNTLNALDTISRQAAIDALKHNQDVYSHNFHDDPIDKYTSAIIAADIDSLVNLPSAQPEIIRCAECKWFQCNMSMDGYLPEGVDEFECRHWCGSCDPVDFCSQAERRKQ